MREGFWLLAVQTVLVGATASQFVRLYLHLRSRGWTFVASGFVILGLRTVALMFAAIPQAPLILVGWLAFGLILVGVTIVHEDREKIGTRQVHPREIGE